MSDLQTVAASLASLLCKSYVDILSDSNWHESCMGGLGCSVQCC